MASITAKKITLYYPNSAAATTTISVRAPQFGDRDTVDRRQVIQETAAGELVVYDRGPARFLLEWDFAYLPVTEKDELLNFFFDIVRGASSEWDMRVPNYSGKQVKLYAGATIAGSSLTAGGGYTAGQVVLADYIYYRQCSFEDGALTFAQSRDGWFDTSLRIRSKGKTL